MANRIQYGIVSLGHIDTTPVQASHQMMMALRQTGEPPGYNILVRPLRALVVNYRAQVHVVPAN